MRQQAEAGLIERRAVDDQLEMAAQRMLYMYSKLEFQMLALRLPPEIEQRLAALAKKTGRSKSYYAREAILRQIEDLEDYYLARRRLARGGPRVTLESLERQLGTRTKRR